MSKISKRAENVPASPIRKLVPYALAAKERGIEVYHLNIGQPDIETPISAIDALKNIDLKILEYSLSEGSIMYRESLSQYYNKMGFEDISPRNFIVTNGGSEALSFAIAVLCDEGDEIIVSEPFYANYGGFSSFLGVKLISVTSSIDTGFALPDIEEFEKKITSKTKAIFICNPSNPTGHVYTEEELKKISEIALKYDISIISDEVYREYIYDDKKHISMLSFPELVENCIIVDSESKRYSLCGARIGHMLTRSQKILDNAVKFAQARLSPGIISEVLATAAHKDDEEYIKKVREEYMSRRDLLVSLLKEIPGVVCNNPSGAFYCMVNLPVDDTDDFAQWLLESYNLDGKTVMLAPGGGFYSDPSFGKKQVRIAYILKKESIKNAVKILKNALEEYNKIKKNSQ